MLSSPECNSWFAAFLTVSVATVSVNLVSIIIFLKNRNLRSRSMYLIINLTVADVLVGGIAGFNVRLFPRIRRMGCKILHVRLTWEGNTILRFVFSWFLLTSLTNVTVISLDRMHATFRPFRHRIIKKWVYGVTISVVWALAAIISAAIMMLNIFDKEWSHLQYFWQSYCVLCLFVICACYTSIIVKIYCGARPQHHGAARRQRKLTVTLCIMTIVSLSMWLPYAVATFVYHTTDSIRSVSH